MRGIGGKVSKKDGYDYISEDLFILCYDNVVFPSHDKAYMQRIIKEDNSFTNSEKVLTEGHTIEFNMNEHKDLFVPNENNEFFMENVHMFGNDYTPNDIYFKELNIPINSYNESNNRKLIDDFLKRL